MNVIFDVLDIRMSEVQTQRVVCPRWETPVLQALHESGVYVLEQTVLEREIPNPGSEFTRLAARYGPKNEDVPYVAAVYGRFGPGVKALRNEIRDSLTNEVAGPCDYKTVAERRIAEEVDQSSEVDEILAEAKARDTNGASADVVNGIVAKTLDPILPDTNVADPALLDIPSTGAQVPVGEGAQELTDEDIASLVD